MPISTFSIFKSMANISCESYQSYYPIGTKKKKKKKKKNEKKKKKNLYYKLTYEPSAP